MQTQRDGSYQSTVYCLSCFMEMCYKPLYIPHVLDIPVAVQFVLLFCAVGTERGFDVFQTPRQYAFSISKIRSNAFSCV